MIRLNNKKLKSKFNFKLNPIDNMLNKPSKTPFNKFKKTQSPNTLQPVKTFNIAGKPVKVFNDLPITDKKTIEKTYDKIPDDTSIPLKFMTRKQYLNKYITNQEIKYGRQFSDREKEEFINKKMPKYNTIIGRYTTKSNPYYPPAVVVFNDESNQKNIQGKNFKKLAWHEYGHELAEQKNLNLDYDKEEWFADRIAEKGLSAKRFNPKQIQEDEESRNYR